MKMTVVVKKAKDIKKGDTVLKIYASFLVPCKVWKVRKTCEPFSSYSIVRFVYEAGSIRSSDSLRVDTSVVCLEPVYKNGVKQ